MAYSFSWYGGSALFPDNYLVTPQVELGGTITFWASAEDLNDFAEHFGIAVSTESGTIPADFTMIQEWTMTAKGGGQGGPRGNREQGTWYQYTVDLSEYAGQTGYIAIRHFNCSDQFALAIDDFFYCDEGTLPDGVTLVGLEPETTYEVQVQGICAYGLTEWSEIVTFTTAEPSTITQTLELSAGWNWISSYIAFDDPEEALLQLEEALGVNGLTIKSKDDYTTYEEGEWGAMGDLEELDNVQMYMIQVVAACTAELVGMPANTGDYEITLTKGWNWIGFPSAVPISLEDAFADFEPADGDRIKSRSDFSSYDSEEGWGATGDLEELTPGEGFMYYSNSDAPKTLVFSVGSK